MFSRLEAWFDYLTSDPLGFAVYALYMAGTVLLSLMLHEVAHGYVALRCGDPTAKWMGRLTLDPRKHLDPVGTACMLLLGFGWAKPVPVNPRNFKNYRRDDFLVSVAGITVNLTLFILCTALSIGVNRLMWTDEYIAFVRDYAGTLKPMIDPSYMIPYQIMNGSFDPAYYGEYLRMPWLEYVQRFLMMMGQINLSLAIFNLLPIPPLDGYHLLNDTLLKGKLQLNHQMFQITRIILLFVCFSGVLGRLLSTVNSAIYDAVLNVFLMMTGG